MGVRLLSAVLVGVMVMTQSGSGAETTGLPPLTQSQLAAALEAQQNRLGRLESTYNITYGTMRGSDPGNAVFVPDAPPLRTSARYGYDRSENHEFVQEETETSVGLVVRSAAFDGKVGTCLRSDPNSEAYSGDVTSGPPEELRPGYVGNWRPSQSLYWPVGGTDLAEMVRRAKRIAIVPSDTTAGQAYRVTLTVDESRIVSFEGSRRPATRIEMYRFSLVPARGFLPARFEYLQPRNRSDLEALDGSVVYERVTSDWRQLESGLWFPSEILAIQHQKERARVARIVVNDVRLGADANIPERVPFPDGTYVTDEVVHLKYRVGAGRSVDKGIDDIVTQVKTLQETAAKGTNIALNAPTATRPSYPNKDLTHGSSLLLFAAGSILVALAVGGLLFWKSRRRRPRHS